MHACVLDTLRLWLLSTVAAMPACSARRTERGSSAGWLVPVCGRGPLEEPAFLPCGFFPASSLQMELTLMVVTSRPLPLADMRAAMAGAPPALLFSSNNRAPSRVPSAAPACPHTALSQEQRGVA